MKKSKFTSLVITLVLLFFTQPSMANVRITPTDKVVYLIDVSGSMIGEGAINTIDVFQSAKNELINAINSMPDSTEIVIIPFAEKTRKPIRLFSNDNDSIISYIQNLQADGKYTDIVAAYQSALKEIDSTKTVAVFFITDGYQNKNLDTNALFQMLEYFPNSQYVTVSTMYYYLTNSRYRNMTICDVFDKSDSMYVVESLCLENANTDVIDTTISTLTNTLSAEKQNPKEFPWWIILLLLAIVVGIYLMKHVQNLPINRLSSTPSINTPQEDNINDDKKLTITQIQHIKAKTGWSDTILGALGSMEEAEIYLRAGLKEASIGGKKALIRGDIDWRDFPIRNNPWLKEKLADYDKWVDYNNADLIGEGYPPRDKNGDPYELHHIGQHQDSPFAELSWAEHIGGGNNAILHPQRESEIDRQQFDKEKSAYWQARYKRFTKAELDSIYK